MKNKTLSLLKIFIIVCFIGFSIFQAACVLMMKERNLDPKSREFYSLVRYIMSDEEKKIFLDLPPSGREEFIEDFWKRRDPDPKTEINEFKIDYLDKIDEANRLFRGGGKPGYIQDRGRIYILFGPPDERYMEPVSKYSSVKSAEVWIYNRIPQIFLRFIDHTGDGEYILEMPDTRTLYEINAAQSALRNPEKFDERFFEFELSITRSDDNKTHLLIEIPYENIWFVEKENRLDIELEVALEIFDSSGNEIWQYQKNYTDSFSEEEVEKLYGKNYSKRIPLDLEKGDYTMIITLNIDDRERKKEFHFKIS